VSISPAVAAGARLDSLCCTDDADAVDAPGEYATSAMTAPSLPAGGVCCEPALSARLSASMPCERTLRRLSETVCTPPSVFWRTICIPYERTVERGASEEFLNGTSAHCGLFSAVKLAVIKSSES